MPVQLRPTTPDDLDFVIMAENHPDNNRYIQQWPREQHAAALNDPNIAHSIIIHPDHAKPIGYTILIGLTSPHRCITLQRFVVMVKGRGYGRQTLERILHQVFNKHQAHRFQLDVKDSNTRAQSLYQSLGFVVEGTLRDCIYTQWGFESFLIMSILEPEYRDRITLN
ncbi:GNAT family N-acetyltransferase [Spirulina major]|uniref:GNAT family N-acetyltransferase n=1 Tax=Spirulina major TaxID=270636 RepID=UPI00093504FC|nr:GNAT family protein [Spirulina major]